jgi:CHAT domain-containing protein
LVEAEVEARGAIEKAGIFYPGAYNYNGNAAAPVSVLAAILLEQGKLDDALYLARIAVNMHESSCSEPQSLGITEARKIWIDAMAEQRNWSGILKLVEAARTALKEYPDLFQQQFGTSLAYIEAELNAGDASRGLQLANTLKTAALKKDGADSYAAAEIEGILALAEAKLKQQNAALKGFWGAMPLLVSGASSNGTAVSGRRQRILQGYMDLLVDLSNSGQSQAAGFHIPSELLRLSSVLRLGRVQKAVSAGAVRAAAGNPELAEVVRQEQDLVEESRALSENLAYLQSAPTATSSVASVGDIRKRLSAVEQARRTLRTEILKNFPTYAELMSPKPMTVPEIQKQLKPGQALVAFHVGYQNSYVWALPQGGELQFSEIKMTRNQLAEKINNLRTAVDPGYIETLNDVPAFDIKLSNALYKSLLEPVKKGWAGAKEILVVTNGVLGALPFSMLAMSPDLPAADGSLLFDRYRKVDWLAHKLAVTYLPSVNALKKGTASVKTKVAERRPFVGFGDPFFSTKQADNAATETTQLASRGFSMRSAPKTRNVSSADLALLPRLADTRDEIMSIANAVGADLTRDVFVGEAASERTVKSMDLMPYDVISFATHGLVPGDLNGLVEPALALTSPDITKNADEDGLLTMNEILALKLNAQFAVLSACNTASADSAGAEAVSGLGRAFFYAGAKALLVSNWPVNSSSTTALMSRMFKSLTTEKGLSRSEGLRKTKRHQIMEGAYKAGGKNIYSYAHPIFWAPFTIVGDGS